MRFAFEYEIKADEVLVRGSWDGFLTHRLERSSVSYWKGEVTVEVIPRTTCTFYVS